MTLSMAFLHFADFQNTQLRQFDVYFNGDQLGTSHSPSSLLASCVYSTTSITAADGRYNVTHVSTAKSVLPPMINAIEIYSLIPRNSPTTFSSDIYAIMAIKFEYGVKKNWTGDPCFPAEHSWNGVKCSNTSDNSTRIISLDLSNSNLQAVSIDDERNLQIENITGSKKDQQDHLQDNENRRFTYKDLEKFTDNFKWLIGKGGFGLVYYGRLEDGIEVAVKLRSESSTHGLDKFLSEVQSLTKVHHRNLVSLVGYCWEKCHLALVYEYMSEGNLNDHLRGLDYLHEGCNPPIIHRDVKSTNILLGQNLQAKIADLGLCRTYLSDSQTHISATAAGTPGFMDPEYYNTGRLTESSDVYSFGVVLLEAITGEPPMVAGHAHIVQRVKQRVDMGDIDSVADWRLGGRYDVNSMWKVVDIALMCTADAGAARPTMADVVARLKDSLALEEARKSRERM